jgi:coenzyme F420-0:L-glutamate ligase/coenzyme F420-1:gamma-L-glutamate ligase
MSLTTLSNIPIIQPGDDLSKIILDRLKAMALSLMDGDILVVAHKIVSKAEGRTVNLEEIEPSMRAREVAMTTGKDPRVVELILRESTGISRMRQGVLIVRHRQGFTSANAGIDRSNVGQNDTGERVLLLPVDPDGSASRLRQAIKEQTGAEIGIIIADSHGRPFRLGTVGVAIGVSGLPALWDRRGERDLFGYQLEHTEVGTADEVASAASLLMGQAAEGTPVVLIRGLNLPDIEGQAKDMIRPAEQDLYR